MHPKNLEKDETKNRRAIMVGKRRQALLSTMKLLEVLTWDAANRSKTDAELSAISGLATATVSRHLKKLAQAGVIRVSTERARYGKTWVVRRTIQVIPENPLPDASVL